MRGWVGIAPRLRPRNGSQSHIARVSGVCTRACAKDLAARIVAQRVGVGTILATNQPAIRIVEALLVSHLD